MKRRTLFRAGTAALALPQIGLGGNRRALKFIPQADLSSLDPVWTTSYVTRNLP